MGQTICFMRLLVCGARHCLARFFQSFEHSLSYFCALNCMYLRSKLLRGIFGISWEFIAHAFSNLFSISVFFVEFFDRFPLFHVVWKGNRNFIIFYDLAKTKRLAVGKAPLYVWSESHSTFQKTNHKHIDKETVTDFWTRYTRDAIVMIMSMNNVHFHEQLNVYVHLLNRIKAPFKLICCVKQLIYDCLWLFLWQSERLPSTFLIDPNDHSWSIKMKEKNGWETLGQSAHVRCDAYTLISFYDMRLFHQLNAHCHLFANRNHAVPIHFTSNEDGFKKTHFIDFDFLFSSFFDSTEFNVTFIIVGDRWRASG